MLISYDWIDSCILSEKNDAMWFPNFRLSTLQEKFSKERVTILLWRGSFVFTSWNSFESLLCFKDWQNGNRRLIVWNVAFLSSVFTIFLDLMCQREIFLQGWVHEMYYLVQLMKMLSIGYGQLRSQILVKCIEEEGFWKGKAKNKLLTSVGSTVLV